MTGRADREDIKPMIIVDAIKGNIKDPEWKTRLAGVAIDWLVLDQWEAQKNRFRKHSEALPSG